MTNANIIPLSALKDRLAAAAFAEYVHAADQARSTNEPKAWFAAGQKHQQFMDAFTK